MASRILLQQLILMNYNVKSSVIKKATLIKNVTTITIVSFFELASFISSIDPLVYYITIPNTRLEKTDYLFCLIIIDIIIIDNRNWKENTMSIIS